MSRILVAGTGIGLGFAVLVVALTYAAGAHIPGASVDTEGESGVPREPPMPMTTTLGFSATPRYNRTFSTTISITPTLGATADVQFEIPGGTEIQSASPPPDVPGTIVTSTTTLTWEDEVLANGVAQAYTVTLRPVDDVRGWVGARVIGENDANDSGIELGSDVMAVLVTEAGGKLSESGDGVFLDESPANSELLISEYPLEIVLLWDEIPNAGETATAAAVVTNVSASAVSYDGDFYMPEGWSVEDGSATWFETLGVSSSSTHTVTVEAADVEGPWSFPVVLDLEGESSDMGYIVRQLGRFDSEGTVWVEGQERVRNADGGGGGGGGLDSIGRGTTGQQLLAAAEDEGGQLLAGCSGASSGNPVYLNIDVDAAGSPASQLSLDVFWYYGDTPTIPSHWYGHLMHLEETRLNDSGQHSMCINVPVTYDYVYVWYYVSTTDEVGGIYKDWSTRVYADLHGRRSIRSACSGYRAFQPSPQPQSFDTDIGDTGADPYPFRLAAIHARYTRSFMSAGPGLNIRGDGLPGRANSAYRVLVWADASSGCGDSEACAPAPHYIIYPAALQRPFDELFLTGHHEYGHTTEYWLKGMPSCYYCGSTQAWIEGWADGVAAPADDNYGGEGRAAYNGSLPIECIPCSPYHPETGVQNMLSMSGTLWDLWDDAGVETYDNRGIEPWRNPTLTPIATQTFNDEVDGIDAWTEGWDLVDASYVQHPCHFRQQWAAQGRPEATEVFAIFEEDGLMGEDCETYPTAPALTPTPSITPGPSPTPTATCGPPYC